MEKGTQGRKGDGRGRGMEGERALVLVFPCAFAPLHLCVHFFPAFHSDPRFIPIRGLQTVDHAVNPILDEPLPKIDHQSESQVSQAKVGQGLDLK